MLLGNRAISKSRSSLSKSSRSWSHEREPLDESLGMSWNGSQPNLEKLLLAEVFRLFGGEKAGRTGEAE